MARPCTAAHTASPSAVSFSAAPISVANAVRGVRIVRKGFAVGQLRTEHQPRQRRAARHEAHIGRADIRDAIGRKARTGCGGDDFRAQFLEAFDRKLDQQRFVIGEMAVGRGMADARASRHGAQRLSAASPSSSRIAARPRASVAQVAMMIAAYANVIVHALASLNFSIRAKRLDVSQRRPPIASTSA